VAPGETGVTSTAVVQPVVGRVGLMQFLRPRSRGRRTAVQHFDGERECFAALFTSPIIGLARVDGAAVTDQQRPRSACSTGSKSSARRRAAV